MKENYKMTPQEAFRKISDYHLTINRASPYQNAKLLNIIRKDAYHAYLYSRELIKTRWRGAEQFIVIHPQIACFYAKDVIKGRWTEAEQYIIKNSYYAYVYSVEVIKGKLSEDMHRAMMFYAISNDAFAKKYFDFINGSTPAKPHEYPR